MTKGSELAVVRKKGKRFRGRVAELRITTDGAKGWRFGIIVPRYAHTAVERNRVKRRFREIVRTELLQLGDRRFGEAVVFALPDAYAATFPELRADLCALCVRAAK